MPYYLALCFNI